MRQRAPTTSSELPGSRERQQHDGGIHPGQTEPGLRQGEATDSEERGDYAGVIP